MTPALQRSRPAVSGPAVWCSAVMVASVVVAPFSPRCQPISTLSIEGLALYIKQNIDTPRLSPAALWTTLIGELFCPGEGKKVHRYRNAGIRAGEGIRSGGGGGRAPAPRRAAGCRDGRPGTSRGGAACRAPAVP